MVGVQDIHSDTVFLKSKKHVLFFFFFDKIVSCKNWGFFCFCPRHLNVECCRQTICAIHLFSKTSHKRSSACSINLTRFAVVSGEVFQSLTTDPELL